MWLRRGHPARPGEECRGLRVVQPVQEMAAGERQQNTRDGQADHYLRAHRICTAKPRRSRRRTPILQRSPAAGNVPDGLPARYTCVGPPIRGRRNPTSFPNAGLTLSIEYTDEVAAPPDALP